MPSHLQSIVSNGFSSSDYVHINSPRNGLSSPPPGQYELGVNQNDIIYEDEIMENSNNEISISTMQKKSKNTEKNISRQRQKSAVSLASSQRHTELKNSMA